MVIDKPKQKAKLVLKMNDYLELISTHCALLFHTKCVYFSQKKHALDKTKFQTGSQLKNTF